MKNKNYRKKYPWYKRIYYSVWDCYPEDVEERRQEWGEIREHILTEVIPAIDKFNRENPTNPFFYDWNVEQAEKQIHFNKLQEQLKGTDHETIMKKKEQEEADARITKTLAEAFALFNSVELTPEQKAQKFAHEIRVLRHSAKKASSEARKSAFEAIEVMERYKFNKKERSSS
jgi:hypothetical protein